METSSALDEAAELLAAYVRGTAPENAFHRLEELMNTSWQVRLPLETIHHNLDILVKARKRAERARARRDELKRKKPDQN